MIFHHCNFDNYFHFLGFKSLLISIINYFTISFFPLPAINSWLTSPYYSIGVLSESKIHSGAPA